MATMAVHRYDQQKDAKVSAGNGICAIRQGRHIQPVFATRLRLHWTGTPKRAMRISMSLQGSYSSLQLRCAEWLHLWPLARSCETCLPARSHLQSLRPRRLEPFQRGLSSYLLRRERPFRTSEGGVRCFNSFD